jgi:hypothetical protein
MFYATVKIDSGFELGKGSIIVAFLCGIFGPT